MRISSGEPALRAGGSMLPRRAKSKSLAYERGGAWDFGADLLMELLPDEVLLEIVKDITHGPTENNLIKFYTRERNILSVQLASKQCFRVATEALYRSVHIVHPKRLHLFLHTLLYYPSYAALVKELQIEYRAYMPLSFIPSTGYYTYKYDEKMAQAARTCNLADVTTGLPGGVAPTQKQQTGVTKVLILLHLLQELDILHIQPRLEHDYLMTRFTTLNGHTSSKLRVLRVELPNTKDINSAVTLAPFFMLRPTKKLVLRSVTSISQEVDDNVFSYFKSISGNSSIESFGIWDARMSSDTLSHLLQLPRELKEFKYYHAYPQVPGHHFFPRLQPALDQVSQSLVVLCIMWYNAEEIPKDTRLDLRSFSKLKDVTVEVELLLGCDPKRRDRLQDALPNSLEVLCLRMSTLWPRAGSQWDNESYVSAIRELIVHKNKELYPGLSMVYMGNEDTTQLLHVAEIKGVTLGWHHPGTVRFE